MRVATFDIASEKLRSAGAVNTGLALRMTRTSTLPARISSTSVGERCRAVHRRFDERRDISHRGAGVTERLVDGTCDGVNGGRLAIAGNDRRLALVGLQIRSDCRGPGPGLVRERAVRGRRGRAHRAGHGSGKGVDIARFERQAMIGIRSGDGGHRLRHIEAVQRILRSAHAAPRRKILRVSHLPGPKPRKSASSDRTTSALSKR